MTTTTAIQQQQVINYSDSIKQEIKDEQRVSEKLTELISQRSMKQKEDSLGITELREQIADLKLEAEFRLSDPNAFEELEDKNIARGAITGGISLGGYMAALGFLYKSRILKAFAPVTGLLGLIVGSFVGAAIGSGATDLEYLYYQKLDSGNKQRIDEIQQHIKTLEQEIEKKQKEAGLI